MAKKAKTVERVLGGDISTTTLNKLESKFETLTAEMADKKYGLELDKEQIEYLTMVFLPNLECENRGAFDISEMLEMINSLISDTKVACSKESIRALFHFLLHTKTTGIDHVYVIKNTLIRLSEVVTEINNDDQLLRDAAFELQAAQQGITPENMAQGLDEVELATNLKQV